MRLFPVFPILAFSFPAVAQEKKADKKTTTKKAATKKQAPPSQDWGHFNAKAKVDLDKHEKKGKK